MMVILNLKQYGGQKRQWAMFQGRYNLCSERAYKFWGGK